MIGPPQRETMDWWRPGRPLVRYSQNSAPTTTNGATSEPTLCFMIGQSVNTNQHETDELSSVKLDLSILERLKKNPIPSISKRFSMTRLLFCFFLLLFFFLVIDSAATPDRRGGRAANRGAAASRRGRRDAPFFLMTGCHVDVDVDDDAGLRLR